MYKSYLHHLWTRIRPIKVWYLLAVTIVFALIGIFGMRANYQHMAVLRQAVYTTDQHNGDVEHALQNLRAFVGSHMNTSLASADGVYPPIQLKYTYERLQQAEKARVDSVNSAIYTDAQHTCEAKYPNSFSGGPRVPCIEQYVKDHGTSPRSIPDAMYKFDFASANWSMDTAGFGIALSILFGALTLLRLGLGIILKKVTR